MCIYVLNFRTHTFASVSNTTEAIAEAKRFVADGASKDEIEIVGTQWGLTFELISTTL